MSEAVLLASATAAISGDSALAFALSASLRRMVSHALYAALRCLSLPSGVGLIEVILSHGQSTLINFFLRNGHDVLFIQTDWLKTTTACVGTTRILQRLNKCALIPIPYLIEVKHLNIYLRYAPVWPPPCN